MRANRPDNKRYDGPPATLVVLVALNAKLPSRDAGLTTLTRLYSDRIVKSNRTGIREMIMEDIEGAIHHFILREFLPDENPQELTESTPLITGGILDSITTLKLVTFLEDHFRITIDAHEAGIDHLDSIKRIAALVGQKRNAPVLRS